MAQPLRIGIAGLGTVGAGAFDILTRKASLLAARAGRELLVTAVSSRSKAKDRGVDLSSVTWHGEALALASDANVDVVVELIGGEKGVAYDLCKAALAHKKHVVTANKALIAHHGRELALLAEKQEVHLAFEAAVAGGIPILKTLREGLAANRFTRILGIINGTCNYILTAMEDQNRDFDDVLKEAQAKGYAETPPDLDIDGHDAAHKLAILTALAHGAAPDFASVYIQGIRHVNRFDIAYASRLGYAIRLLGITRRTAEGVEQRVHPCLIPKESMLAKVKGAQNALLAECDSVGPLVLTGAGAGAGPTASSVVADLIDIARGYPVHPFGVPASALDTSLNRLEMSRRTGQYYLRIRVADRAGVLADITSIVSQAGNSIDKILQTPDDEKDVAQIAITLDDTMDSAVQQVVAQLSGKDYVLGEPHVIPIEIV